MAGTTFLGLDVGSVRVGVALARVDVRLPQPFTTLEYNPDIYDQIVVLTTEHDVAEIIVGWPRGMQGQSTDQTAFVEDFVEKLRQQTTLPIKLQDEALTSRKAEAELQARNKPYQKADVDALAATYILDDYLQTVQAHV